MPSNPNCTVASYTESGFTLTSNSGIGMPESIMDTSAIH